MSEKPRLVTACWFTRLPPEYAAIGISRGVPKSVSGYQRYEPLNPLREGFHAPLEVFTQIYNERVLGMLNPEQVVADLLAMAGGRIPAMLCFEHPPPNRKPCHRALVSVWLWEKLGLEVPELHHEHEGWGWCHPKLDWSMRRRPGRGALAPTEAGRDLFTEALSMSPPEPLVPDRSLEILPHVGKYFRWGSKAFKVVGVDPDQRDHALVTDGTKEQAVHIDLLVKRLD